MVIILSIDRGHCFDSMGRATPRVDEERKIGYNISLARIYFDCIDIIRVDVFFASIFLLSIYKCTRDSIMCQVGTAVGAKSDALERIAVDCELINRELDSTQPTLAQHSRAPLMMMMMT
jgi:hypothetical protein